MTVESLQSEIRTIKPLLDANLAAAHEEYMAGDIAAGAFRYVRSRHGLALDIMEHQRELPVETVYRVCAPITIDLRSACEDAGDNAPLERWLALFDAAGFVGRTIFDVPMLPTPPDTGE